jgi:hypothetical protein
MTFAKFVFIGAGLWGVVVLTPLYFLVDLTGKPWAAPDSYPHFFYGFLSLAMAWQAAFFVIGSDPVRFRPLMIPGILEKLGFVITAAVLYGRSRISADEAMIAAPDLLLAALFVAAYLKVSRNQPSRAEIDSARRLP